MQTRLKMSGISVTLTSNTSVINTYTKKTNRMVFVCHAVV